MIMAMAICVGAVSIYVHTCYSETVANVFLFMLSIALGALISILCARRDCERKDNQEIIDSLRKKMIFSNPEQFELYLSQVSLGVIVWDKDFHIVSCNPEAEKIFGFTESELIGKHATLIVPLNYHEQIDDFWADLLATKNGKHGLLKNITKDGHIIFCEWVNVPICDQNGVSVSMYSIVQDVTVRKNAEIALHESENKLKGMLTAVRDFVYVIEPDGKISYANPNALEVMGVREDQLENVLLSDILDAGDLQIATERIGQMIDTQKSQSMQVYNLRSISDPKKNIPVEIYSVPFVEKGVKKVLGVARPIDERLQLEAERSKIERMNSIGVMAGGIAHDFNNMLSAILGYASLILNKKDVDIDQYLHHIIAASERATGLTQQLLTFAKGGTSVKEISSVEKAIRESAEFALGANSQCRCEIILPDDLWLVMMDYKQICQVIQNLVINASHAMPSGGVISICGKNEFVERENLHGISSGKYVHFFVKDVGIGISKKHLTQIFDPYFTTKGKTGEGSGLGLSVAYAIITNHSGYICVDSVVGEGSIFHVYLPAVDVKQTVAIEQKHEVSLSTHVWRILVLDDMPENCSMFQTMIQAMGHICVGVTSGEDALKIYDKSLVSGEAFDLIITDLTMPGDMSGAKFAAEIKKKNSQAKILAISGFYAGDLSSDFTGFLQKPFEIRTLSTLIKKIMQ